MAGHDNDYVEFTTRLRSVLSFCDFLSNGGTVHVAMTDRSPYRDVTASVLERKRAEAEALARTRRQLFPEQADEDITPALYSRH